MNDAAAEPDPLPIWVGMMLWEAERVLIRATLEHTRWQMTETARMLGIDRSTLYAKLVRHGIERRQLEVTQA